MPKTLNLKAAFRKLQFRYESLKLCDCYVAPNRTVCKMLHTLGKNQYIFGLTILLGPSAKSLSTSRPFSWFLYKRSDFRPPLLHIVYSRDETGSEQHSTSHSMGSRVLFPGVKRPGREVNHSPPTSAKAKNEWSYTSNPPSRLHGVDRKNLLFTFLQQVWTYVRIHTRTHARTRAHIPLNPDELQNVLLCVQVICTLPLNSSVMSSELFVINSEMFLRSDALFKTIEAINIPENKELVLLTNIFIFYSTMAT